MSDENTQDQEEGPPKKHPEISEPVDGKVKQDKSGEKQSKISEPVDGKVKQDKPVEKQPKLDDKKPKPAGESKEESARGKPSEQKETEQGETEGQTAPPEGSGADDSERGGEASDKTNTLDGAEDEDKISELTPERLRKTTSEARDYHEVRRTFSDSTDKGMFVGHDVHVSGDLVMQVEAGKASRRDAEARAQISEAVPVEYEERRRIQYVYQPPQAYQHCHARLQERHIVILLGQVHAGKRATAIKLAMDMLGGMGDLTMEYGRRVDLVSIIWQPGTAYLVDGFSAERLRSLEPTDLRRLSLKLKSLGSYLVLCADPAARPHEDIVREFGVHLKPPSVKTSLLLEMHLALHGGDELGLEHIQNFLKSPELKPVLRQPLLPQKADDLSRILLRVLHEELELGEALEGYTANPEGQVMDWFEEAGDDIEERAFRIALAAFHGARYSAVEQAAKDLAEKLQPPLPEDPENPPPPPPSPFAQRRSPRLKRARAHLDWASEPGSELPGSRIEVVKLDDENYARQLLRYVWSEYAGLRNKLLSWLSSYAVGHTADVRTRAAGAIGALASQELPTVRKEVLIPWIKQDDRQCRAAIGRALGLLVMSDQHSSTVIAMLDDWSKRSDQRYRWAAARAYGDVGLYDPRLAMEQWRKILISAEKEFDLAITTDWRVVLYPRLFSSILDTIVNFFLAAVEESAERFREIYEDALEELKIWCDLDREEKKHHSDTAMGLNIFTLLADVYFGEPGLESDPETWPPPMLLLVDSEFPKSPYRMTLAQLFRSALNWRPTQKDALDALKNWLVRVDHDTRLEEQMIAVLRDIAFGEGATARDQGRLSAYLDRWSRHPREPIKSAGRAREELFS